MAPRPKPAEGDDVEIFSDLTGATDGDGDDEVVVVDRGGRSVPLPSEADDAGITDEDLEVEDDDDDTEIAAAYEGEEEEEADETEVGADEEVEEIATVAANGAEDFDPKDVTILALEARSVEGRKRTATDAVTRADADMAAAKVDMKKAKEAGDTDADIAATEKYAQAMSAKQRAEGDLDGIKGMEADLTRRAGILYAKAPKDPVTGKPVVDGSLKVTKASQPAADKPSKLAPKFFKLNPWFNNAKYAKAREALVKLDTGLAAENRLNKNDPKYFEELGKRFNSLHPGLFKNLDGKPIATGRRQRQAGGRPPANGGGGNGGGTPPRERTEKKIKLEPADLAAMRQFNLDPDSKEARKAWLIEKRAQAKVGR